jgi:hypothetical protein
MKRLVFALLAGCVTEHEMGGEDVDVRIGPVPEEHVWSRAFGSSGAERMEVAVDGTGDVIGCGYYGHMGNPPSRALDLGGGALPGDDGFGMGFVAKYRGADGAHLWSRRFGGGVSAEAASCAVDPSGAVVVAGTFGGNTDFGGGEVVAKGETDAFVAKYAPDGELVWARNFGGWVAYATDVAVDAGGAIVVMGWFDGTMGFAEDGGPEPAGAPLVSRGGGYDLFLVKLDADGNVLWVRGLGGPGADYGGDVDVGEDGAIVMTGAIGDGADLGAGPTAGGDDAFLASFTSEGVLSWSRRFHAASAGIALDVDIGPGGGVWFGAAFRADVDLGGGTLAAGENAEVLARFTSGGEHVWSRTMDGRAGSVAVDEAGKLYVVGTRWGVLLHVYGEDGELLRVRDFGGRCQAYGGGLALERPDDVVVSGMYIVSGEFCPPEAELDLGGGILPYTGGDWDVFLGRLSFGGEAENL